MNTPRATYKKIGGSWRGVIKIDDKIIWECKHSHRNRGQSTQTSGQAAMPCAALCLKYANLSEEKLTEDKEIYRRLMEPGHLSPCPLPRSFIKEREYALEERKKIQQLIEKERQ